MTRAHGGTVRVPSRRTGCLTAMALAACVASSHPLAAQALVPLDSSFGKWVRANAIAVPSVDAPYADASYAFLRPLIGNARLLAIGENIHGGHQPLALRNHIIRYAVTQLGFTAVALESGFTEAMLVDRFVQGGEGNVDSVTRAGISYGFGDLRENRELVQWLRQHNERTARKVHFYGIDQTGVGDPRYSGVPAVEAALAYLARVDSAGAAHQRARLAPLLDRFAASDYGGLSMVERLTLRGELQSLERTLQGSTTRPAAATSPRQHALAVRNAWAALRLEQSFAGSGREGPRALSAIRLRDSVMAENTRWVLTQVGAGGKAIVFAHNGHSMSVPMYFPAMGVPMTMMGQRLRASLGEQMRIIGMAASTFTDMGHVPGDMSSFEVAMVRAQTPNYAIDLRTSDRVPKVSAMLRRPWLTRLHAWLQPFVPRDVTGIYFVLDTITPTKSLAAPVAARSTRAAADSFQAVLANRVVLDIKAPAMVVWSFLPSIRQRPNAEKVPLNGVTDQAGGRFDMIFRDSTGKVVRHDRLEVLDYEPGERYAAHITYLPPASPMQIVYNVDMRESAGITHFVMDAFATVWLPDPGSDAERVALYTMRRKEFQEATSKGYAGLKDEVEAAARR